MTVAASQKDVDWESGKITDAGLAHMHAQIGVKEIPPAWNRTVTADTIWHFALGVGDDNPLWWDEGYAAATRWEGLIAPPTYLFSHTSGPRLTAEQGESMAERFLPGCMGLWASERWRWRRPARVGEKIHAEAWLAEVRVSDRSSFGGRSVAQTERQDLVTDTGEVLVEIDRTLKRFEREQARARSSLLDRALAHYSAEDRARFEAQYVRELGMRRGAKPRYVEDVREGELVGPMLKGPLLLGNILGFLLGAGNGLAPTNRMHQQLLDEHPSIKMIHPESGAAENFQAQHFDPAFARIGGMPTGYDFGMQRFSWLAHLVTDWMGDDGFLAELEFRLRQPNFINDVTWLSGRVAAVHIDEGRVELELSAVNQLDELTAGGRAVVQLPKRPG
jgi:acyl dehydratase